MSKKAIDVDKAIAITRANPGLAPVADLAEIGRAVCEAIRAHGGLPRVRQLRAKADGKARLPKPTPQSDRAEEMRTTRPPVEG